MNRRGITLLELLVAIGLTGIVSFMAWNLLHDEQTHYTRTKTKIKLQADAKDAMRIIEGEMRNTGFNVVQNGALGANRTSIVACSTSTEDSRISPATGDSSSFRFVDNNGVPGGDQIEFRFHQAGSDGMTSCTDASTPLQSVSYRYNAGRLERRFCQGSAVASCPTNGTWVPFLDSVVSFHLQYGVAAETTEVVLGNADLITPATWSTVGGLSLATTLAAGDTSFAITGFNNTRRYVRFLTAFPRYRRTDTYLLSFRVVGNEAWRIDKLKFAAGMYKSDGTVDGVLDTLTASVGYAIAGSTGWMVHTLFTPSVDADGSRYLGFEGQLVAAPASAGHTVTLRNIQVRRISRGEYFRWVENPTVAEKRRVTAVRVSLLVKSRRTDADPAPGTYTGAQLGESSASFTPSGAAVGFSYLLMQRIIPVVNNASL